MKYYILRQDVSISDKWVLGDVRHVDNWNFSNPPVNFMEPGRYTIDVRFDGNEVDYSLAGYASAPVLSAKACDALAGLSEIDEPYRNVVFAPVQIEGKQTSQDYFLMIIETQIDCVDEDRSNFSKYDCFDPIRPDLAGSYRSFFNLVVDPEKINSSNIFRIKKYLGVIIVSEEIKERFEKAGVVGVIFESVNGDRVTVA
ncbi:Uncharacterised protein [Pannonibacter phragmitetus]|uniref:Immunity MXAN-0049 protein domain-containing protein n=1 Tax=Pannonibacter phragmitetus TaxID=121719 RepID=A0A379HJX0_9HYPH|nr:DUF1629 domain-containing protein [Pannonibacter phragmitetus]SUC82804.1 Uncharacterised protein [Pannonibacter phragmitetus]